MAQAATRSQPAPAGPASPRAQGNPSRPGSLQVFHLVSVIRFTLLLSALYHHHYGASENRMRHWPLPLLLTFSVCVNVIGLLVFVSMPYAGENCHFYLFLKSYTLFLIAHAGYATCAQTSTIFKSWIKELIQHLLDQCCCASYETRNQISNG